jgi:hypothetical protein
MRMRSTRKANQNSAKSMTEVRPVPANRMEDPAWRAAYERMVALLDGKPGTGVPVGEITEDDKYGDASP